MQEKDQSIIQETHHSFRIGQVVEYHNKEGELVNEWIILGKVIRVPISTRSNVFISIDEYGLLKLEYTENKRISEDRIDSFYI